LLPIFQPALQIVAGLFAIGSLGQLRGVNAGQAHRDPLAAFDHPDGVAITDGDDSGSGAAIGAGERSGSNERASKVVSNTSLMQPSCSSHAAGLSKRLWTIT